MIDRSAAARRSRLMRVMAAAGAGALALACFGLVSASAAAHSVKPDGAARR